MRNLSNIFYVEWKKDLIRLPLVTFIFIACLSLPLSLPFVIFYPATLLIMMYRRERDGYRTLEEKKEYSRIEANRLYDGRVFMPYILYVLIPLFCFNYYILSPETGIFTASTDFILSQNSYFLDFVRNTDLMKPFIFPDYYQALVMEKNGYILYGYSITLIMSMFMASFFIWYAKPLMKTWERRYDKRDQDVFFQIGKVIALAPMPIIISFMGLHSVYYLGFVPYTNGELFLDHKSLQQSLFLISSALFLALNLIFIIFGFLAKIIDERFSSIKR